MQKIFSFEDFLFENLDLSYFTMTKELTDVIKEIDDPIATQLVKDQSWQPIRSKVTLLDLDRQQLDKWWFVNSVKVNQFLKDKFEDKFIETPNENQHKDQIQYFLLNRSEITEKYKSSSKIGRIINKIYPDKYKPTDIELFVNKYKKHFTANFELVDIVKGKDINKWYDCKNYNTTEVNGSELQNSCMRQSDKNNFMDFYAINDGIEMVVLFADPNKKWSELGEKEKIDARAILWTPDTIDGEENTQGLKFMDRIYYNKQEHKNTLQKYAENQGWFLKHDNDSSINGKVYNPKTNEKKKIIFTLKDMKIPEHHKFPFADTLAVFDPETNILSNDDSKEKIGWLSSTSGSLEGMRWLPYKNRFYHSSDVGIANGLNGEEVVLKSDAILVPAYRKLFTRELMDTKELVKVKGIDGGTKEVFKEDVVDGYDGKKYFKNEMKYSGFLDEYIPKNNAIYVDSMDSWMPKEDLIKVITSIWRGEAEDTEYYHMDDPGEPYFKHTDGKYYLNNLKDDLEKWEKMI